MTTVSKSVQAVLFCLLLVGKFNSVLAQSIELKWGKEFVVKERMSDYGTMLGEDEEYYYVLRTTTVYEGLALIERKVCFLESYSMDHNLIKSVKLETGTKPKAEGNFEAMYMLKGRFVMFFSEFDSKADLNMLYSVTVDKEGKHDKPVIIDKEPAKSAKKSGRYSFVVSEDKARILVIRNASYDKKSTEKFKYIMLADDMKTLWEKDVELPYMDKQFAINKYVIDETGNVFMLGTYKQEGAEIEQYKILAYNYTIDELKEIKVSYGETIVIHDLNFFYSNAGLHIVGFCSKANDQKKRITGVFYNRVNAKSYQVEIAKIEDFDKETLSKFKPLKKYQNANIGVVEGYYHIRNIIPRADGRIHLVAEDRSESLQVAMDGYGRQYPIIWYTHNDIIVIQLSQEGKVDWTSCIPKKQEGRVFDCSSYLLAKDDEHIYFLYNDNPKNAESFNNNVDDVKITHFENLNKLTMVLATVDNKGGVVREVFGKTKEKGSLPFITSNYALMTKDRIWVIGAQGSKKKFGFLTLKGNG